MDKSLSWARLLSRHPGDVNVWLWAAVTAPNPATAEDYARRAVEADSVSGDAQPILAQILVKKGTTALHGPVLSRLAISMRANSSASPIA